MTWNYLVSSGWLYSSHLLALKSMPTKCYLQVSNNLSFTLLYSWLGRNVLKNFESRPCPTCYCLLADFTVGQLLNRYKHKFSHLKNGYNRRKLTESL